MSNRHNLRKGVATLLSVLSVGGAASAEEGLSKSQNLRISNSSKVNLKKDGGKKKLSSSQNFSSARPNLSKKGNALNKSDVVSEGPKVQLNGNMGYLEHFKAGASDLYSRYGKLSRRQQVMVTWGILEGICILGNHKGIVENLSNLIFSRFVEIWRYKIFKDVPEGIVNTVYNYQDFAEDVVIANLGPVTSMFAKFAFYLKDSWIDPFVALVKGLLGMQPRAICDFIKGEEVTESMNKLARMSFRQFKGFIDEGMYGKTQLKALWHMIGCKGFKTSPLNMWFYSLGWQIRGKKVPIVKKVKKGKKGKKDKKVKKFNKPSIEFDEDDFYDINSTFDTSDPFKFHNPLNEE